jgi:penicillin-binding protein 1A
VRLLLVAVTLSAVAGIAGLGTFYSMIVRPLPVLNSLGDYEPKLITHIRARDGRVIRALAEERRIVVPIDRVPRHVIDAFLASEDKSFYEHDGLDYKGIARAFLENLKAGRITQGGSTITQQVAKTFLLTSDRTVVRKLKDMVLALRIDGALEKNQILYLYLNQIYLGSGAYGVEAAAQTYFGKSVEELTVAEAAMIVGVVPSPNNYSPLRNFSEAKRRQSLVLARMLDERHIDRAAYEAALAEPMALRETKAEEYEVAARYFTEEVRRYLVSRYGAERVLTGGLDVTTSMDIDRQIYAWRAIRDGLHEHDRRRGYRGPIRTADEAAWPETIAELAADPPPGAARPGELPRRRGLIVAVDDDAGTVRVALGGESYTTLRLRDVRWAYPADPDKDGAITWVKKVSDAVSPGWLVWLETLPQRGEEEPSRYGLYQEPLGQGALVSFDVETGYLDAMIGGYDFDDSQFNRAVQAKRQPGSSFKPLIYAEALRHGYTPTTIVLDTPLVFTDDLANVWKPRNYSGEFSGPITMREALALSRNIATIRILQDIGIDPVVKRARALGISAELAPNLGLALGSSEVTLFEIVRAYGAFAAQGRIVDPIFILEVRDRDGTVLESNVRLMGGVDGPLTTAASMFQAGLAVDDPAAQPDVADAAAEGDPALGPTLRTALGEALPATLEPGELPPGYGLDPASAFLMTHMLQAVVEEGTARRLRSLERPLAGKTGTTNDLYDAWFIGFSPKTVAGVWVGYDIVQPLGRNETGGRTASPIFLEYMRGALKGEPERDFQAPPGIEFARVDKKSGKRSLARDAIFVPYAAGTAPVEFASPDGEGATGRPVRLD